MSALKRIAALKKLHLNFRQNWFETHKRIDKTFLAFKLIILQLLTNLLKASKLSFKIKTILRILSVIYLRKPQNSQTLLIFSRNPDESTEEISEWKVRNLLASVEHLPSLKNFGYQVRGYQSASISKRYLSSNKNQGDE